MIRFQDMQVSFPTKHGFVEAVKGASFEVRKGEIFGIVGTSGAGKSTLLRTINLLQRPTGGSAWIDGRDITNLSGQELRSHRANTGMVFQHFNLIHTKTAYDNVAFAMKAAGRTKAEIDRRVPEVLELVGLQDRMHSYPSQLSGGQKQRVGIARAIVNNPGILLCDEPTSALDLDTTNSILELLHDIIRRLGITTVIISHEMSVIKKICNSVAVMKDGEIVEIGPVYDVFAAPRHSYTKQLVYHTINFTLPDRLLGEGRKLLKIVFRGEGAEEPVIADTIARFNIRLNILHGKIEYIAGLPLGILIVGLNGEPAAITAAEDYLRQRAAEVEAIDD